MIKARPFVKWAGGKGRLIPQLEGLLPMNFDELHDVTYVEPFVGGGAMLFHMLQQHKNITRAVINDINQDLIHCYRLIKDNPNALISYLEDFENVFNNPDIITRQELYYSYRYQYNECTSNSDERAALFIFLNHICFNGLFRVNAEGKFNVPFGKYTRPIRLDKENLWEEHKLMKDITLIIRDPGDYQQVRRNLTRKTPNFVYLDPPYRPISVTSSFKGYSNIPFGDLEQEKLKVFCDELNNKGCLWMLSNSDSLDDNGDSYFEKLYDEYNLIRIFAPRCINAIPDKRIRSTEVLIRNY